MENLDLYPTENPKWGHRPGDMYSVVACQWVGNVERGFEPSYRLVAGPFLRRKTAWQHGLSDLGHDDFNLVVVRDGSIVASLWDDELVDDDPDVLAEIGRQTALESNLRAGAFLDLTE